MARKLLLILPVIFGLSGCAAIVIGGATVGAVSIAEDKRPVGVQFDDTTYQGKITWALANAPEVNDHTNINAYVNNGVVLLTGQAPSEKLKQQAEMLARKVTTVKKIHNQIRIAEPTAFTTRAHDTWLSSKVQANLYGSKNVNAFQMEIIVEDSEVFLMGQVTSLQAEKAVEITRNIGGVVRVVNAFEIIQ